VSTQACSRDFANLAKSGLLSNFALCSKPVKSRNLHVILSVDVWGLIKDHTSGPCEDWSNWICTCWLSLLMLSVMSGDGSVG
jgi:hypothetical protein